MTARFQTTSVVRKLTSFMIDKAFLSKDFTPLGWLVMKYSELEYVPGPQHTWLK